MADRYSYVAARLGIAPMFDLAAPVSAGVLIYPTVLDDSVMYIIISDAAEEAKIDLRDRSTAV